MHIHPQAKDFVLLDPACGVELNLLSELAGDGAADKFSHEILRLLPTPETAMEPEVVIQRLEAMRTSPAAAVAPHATKRTIQHVLKMLGAIVEERTCDVRALEGDPKLMAVAQRMACFLRVPQAGGGRMRSAPPP